MGVDCNNYCPCYNTYTAVTVNSKRRSVWLHGDLFFPLIRSSYTHTHTPGYGRYTETILEQACVTRCFMSVRFTPFVCLILITNCKVFKRTLDIVRFECFIRHHYHTFSLCIDRTGDFSKTFNVSKSEFK